MLRFAENLVKEYTFGSITVPFHSIFILLKINKIQINRKIFCAINIILTVVNKCRKFISAISNPAPELQIILWNFLKKPLFILT